MRSHPVVVGLDLGGFGLRVRRAFDHVRIERALGEHFGIADGVPEDIDEHVADDLALLLGIGLAGERGEELLGGIDRFDRHADAVEVALHLRRLVFAQQAVIDEDRADLRRRLRWSRTASTVLSTPPETPQTTWLVPTVSRMPSIISRLKSSMTERQQVTGVSEEIVQDPQALVAVGDFRVELDAEEQFVPLQRNGRAVLVGGDDFRTFRQDFHRVRVTHPDLRAGGNAFVEPVHWRQETNRPGRIRGGCSASTLPPNLMFRSCIP